MARKVVVSPDRRAYIAAELDARDYTRANADRAEYWIKWGDWSMKGNDPTLTLDDFYPTDAQYATGYERVHMQRMQSQAMQNKPRTIEEFEDYKRRYIHNDGIMH